MRVCPECGNHIPSWAHGVCPICERNRRDYQRYGRRRPARKKQPTKSTPSKPIGSRNCKICGKKVREDHIKSHLWHAHQLSPYATKKETQRARDTWEQKGVTKPDGKDIKPKTKKCPICGFEVPLDLVVAHKIYHRRAKNKAKESGVSISTKSHSGDTRLQPYRVAKAMPAKLKRAQKHKAPAQQMVKGVNCLLEDIFGCPTRLSQILRKAGISQAHIDLIRTDHLESYLSDLVNRWVIWWSSILPPACVAILIRRYDLMWESEQESSIGNILGRLSSSEKDQLQAAALTSLRKQKHKTLVERCVVKGARIILEGSS